MARGSCQGMHVPPCQGAFLRLQSNAGVGQLEAASILAETGTDLRTVPTAEKMASWAGLCPGNRESAGKKKGSQTTQGNCYLRTTLVQCAWAATRKRGCIFQTRFRELTATRTETCHRRDSPPDAYSSLLHAEERRSI